MNGNRLCHNSKENQQYTANSTHELLQYNNFSKTL